MNHTIKVKHAVVFFLAIFLLGAAGTQIADNIRLDSYLQLGTPSTTPAVSASGFSKVYYDSTNQGLAITNNAGTVVPLMAGRNKFVNGNFNIWQRGTASVTVPTANAAYLADHWLLSCASTGSVAMVQTTNISGVPGAYNGIRLSQTATTNTPGAGTTVIFRQIIEGYNIIPLNNKQFTVSFWAKTNLTGTYGVSIQDSVQSVSYVRDMVVANTNWNKYVYTFTHVASSGTWNYTNGVGMYFQIALVGGSTYQHAAGDNLTGLYVGTSSMTNTWTTSSSNTMDFAQFQIESGATATEFEQLDNTVELTRCLRYCWVIDFNNGGANTLYGNGTTTSATASQGIIQLPVRMRISPAVTFAGNGSTKFGFTTSFNAGPSTATNTNGALQGQYIIYFNMSHAAATFPGANIPGWFEWQAGSASGDMVIISAD